MAEELTKITESKNPNAQEVTDSKTLTVVEKRIVKIKETLRSPELNDKQEKKYREELALLESEVEKDFETKIYFYESALANCKIHYDRLSEAKKVIESKAQANITIAGIFLAAGFAFTGNLEDLNLSQNNKAFLGVTILLLIASVICSLYVLFLSTTKLSRTGEHTIELAEDLSNVARLENVSVTKKKPKFLEELITNWENSIQTVNDSKNRKTIVLNIANICLVVAMFLVGIMTAFIIF